MSEIKDFYKVVDSHNHDVRYDPRYEPKNINIQSHITSITNPHDTNKTQIGLGNVQNVDTTDASNITTGTLPDTVIPTNIVRDNEVGTAADSALATKQCNYTASGYC